jgi:hypothetical protein
MKRDLHLCFLIILTIATATAMSATYTPSYGRQFLVAGNSEPGLGDGNFIESSFRAPQGLALSPKGDALYVADCGNQAIRVIDLTHHNRVGTLSKAGGLQSPVEVAMGRDGKTLYVLDQGQSRLQALDIGSGKMRVIFKVNAAIGETPLSNLCMDPTGRWPLLIDMRGQQILEFPPGGIRILGRSQRFGLPGLRLACLPPRSAYLFDPSTGQAEILRKGGEEFFAHADGAAALQFYPWQGKVPQGQGFVPALNAQNEACLAVWDQWHGLFTLFKPLDRSVEDIPLYDNRGLQLSQAPPEDHHGFFERVRDQLRYNYNALELIWIKRFEPQRLEHEDGYDSRRPDRAPFVGPSSFCFDPFQHLLYVAEQDSNRILALKMAFPNFNLSNPLRANRYPVKKGRGVTRILILTDSLAVNEGRNQFIRGDGRYPKQFETYLNALNAMHGSGKRYEVLLWSEGAPSYQGSPMSKLLGLGPILQEYQIDEVMLGLSHETMASEALSWAKGPTKDDLSTEDIDLGFYFIPTPEKASALGPLGREFFHYLRQHPERWPLWHEGWPNANLLESEQLLFLEDPQIHAMILKKLDYVLAKDIAFLKPKGIKLSIFNVPHKIFISSGETAGGGLEGNPVTMRSSLDAPFGAIATRQGVPYYDPLKMMRLMDPVVFPLYAYGDPHWLAQAHQWFGWLLAQQVYYEDR